PRPARQRDEARQPRAEGRRPEEEEGLEEEGRPGRSGLTRLDTRGASTKGGPQGPPFADLGIGFRMAVMVDGQRGGGGAARAQWRGGRRRAAGTAAPGVWRSAGPPSVVAARLSGAARGRPAWWQLGSVAQRGEAGAPAGGGVGPGTGRR